MSRFDDSIYARFKAELGDGWNCIKEQQRWGWCPTWVSAKTGEVRFVVYVWGRYRLLGALEMKQYLILNWTPSSEDDVTWFERHFDQEFARIGA